MVQTLYPKEIEDRICLAKQVLSGELTVKIASSRLNITTGAFYRWIGRNKSNIGIVNFPSDGVSCSKCDLRFYDRRSYSSHYSNAHDLSGLSSKMPSKRDNNSINRSRHKTRIDVINKYGGKCVCCGEDCIDFLTIDHVDGGGSKHKKQIKKNIYVWLKQNFYPTNFQVMCYNCNSSKGVYGVCGHTRALKSLLNSLNLTENISVSRSYKLKGES